MSDPTRIRPSEPVALNPELRREHDPNYTEDQHGSTPLETISVRKQGPAVWPVVWAVVTILLIGISLFLIFG